MVLEIILALIILLLVIFLFLSLKKDRNYSLEFENILNRVWRESGIDEKIGQLNLQTKEIKDLHSSFEKMLTTPTQRGYFGEVALEVVLRDQLPPDMYGIREQLSSGKKPDAYIKSTSGIICIDSKFPLDNYLRMLEATEEERESYKKVFLNDVKKHLDKIKTDYIMPEAGTAPFAFVYIPSESVWTFLLEEAFEMLREYSAKGVQVLSPLTMSSKIEFIKAGVQAKKLSEEAQKVQEKLQILSRIFNELDEKWRIFSEKHLKSLLANADEIDKKYKKLRQEFEKINKIE